MRRAAARVARRRGSSTTIRRPASHGSSSRASGTMVVLPAPGGAASDRSRAAGERSAQLVEDLDDREVGEQRAQASAGDPRNGPGSPDDGDVGWAPRRRVGDGVGDTPPGRHAPPLGGGRHGAVDADEHEGRQLAEPERLDGNAVGIGEHQEPLDERAEEGAGVAGVGGDEEVDAGVRAAEALEDPCRRRQDPRALVGVRVECDGGQVERRQPLLEGSWLAAERGQHEIHRRVRRHGLRR